MEQNGNFVVKDRRGDVLLSRENSNYFFEAEKEILEKEGFNYDKTSGTYVRPILEHKDGDTLYLIYNDTSERFSRFYNPFNNDEYAIDDSCLTLKREIGLAFHGKYHTRQIFRPADYVIPPVEFKIGEIKGISRKLKGTRAVEISSEEKDQNALTGKIKEAFSSFNKIPKLTELERIVRKDPDFATNNKENLEKVLEIENQYRLTSVYADNFRDENASYYKLTFETNFDEEKVWKIFCNNEHCDEENRYQDLGINKDFYMKELPDALKEARVTEEDALYMLKKIEKEPSDKRKDTFISLLNTYTKNQKEYEKEMNIIKEKNDEIERQLESKTKPEKAKTIGEKIKEEYEKYEKLLEKEAKEKAQEESYERDR